MRASRSLAGATTVLSRRGGRLPYRYSPSSRRVVGGDELRLDARLDPGAHALFTTPAAGKFYRSAGSLARQTQCLTVAPGAALEWLPQENIVYNGARLQALTRIDLQGDACFIGWEMLCLGRPAADEIFTTGECWPTLELWRDGEPLYLESNRYARRRSGAGRRLGLQGQPVSATLLSTPGSCRGRFMPFAPPGTPFPDRRNKNQGGRYCARRHPDLPLSWPIGGAGPAFFYPGVEFAETDDAQSPTLPFPFLEYLTRCENSMELTPREKDKLLLFTAGLLAERRKAKGLKLNYPEAVAYLSCALLEGRAGGRSVAELMSDGRTLLTRDEVMDGVPE
jgi:urease gamma subunit